MEVTGNVHYLGNEEQITASFTKRELVIRTEEQYPQFILIEFGQGKCNDYLDKLQKNDLVKVSINLRGREWINPKGETKYFNSIQGWRIEKLENPVSSEAVNEMPVHEAKIIDGKEEHDDLPF